MPLILCSGFAGGGGARKKIGHSNFAAAMLGEEGRKTEMPLNLCSGCSGEGGREKRDGTQTSKMLCRTREADKKEDNQTSQRLCRRRGRRHFRIPGGRRVWRSGCMGIRARNESHTPVPPKLHTWGLWGYGTWCESKKSSIPQTPLTPIPRGHEGVAYPGYGVEWKFAAYPNTRLPGWHGGMEVWEYGGTGSKRDPHPHTPGPPYLGEWGYGVWCKSCPIPPYPQTPIPWRYGGTRFWWK